MVVFGSLIKSTYPDGICLDERICFLGMGFGYEGVPIDAVGLFLAGLETKRYYILLVDEFQRFNGAAEECVALGLRQTQKALHNLSSLYGFEPEIIVSSDFMRSQEYKMVLSDIGRQIEERELTGKLLQTVPERYRDSKEATRYSLNEIACVEFLRKTRQMEVKAGPSKEKVYDEIIQDLGLDISFAYVLDAYALGTKEPEQVVHYTPAHRGRTNGQRLLLNEPICKAESKLLLGPEEAAKYLSKLASVAGHRLNREYLTEEEIESLHGKKLKKIARRLVLENILRPYKEAAVDEH